MNISARSIITEAARMAAGLRMGTPASARECGLRGRRVFTVALFLPLLVLGRKGIAAALCLAVIQSVFVLSSNVIAAEIPAASIKVPPMVKEESISTFVPSEAAPGQGLAVNMIFAAKPRYKDGAPLVVVVPGGNGSQGLDFSMHAAQQGFVEIRFAFPGGGKPGFTSSGIYDNRGVKSQEALRDVLRFAAGEINDHSGKNISELLPLHLHNKTVGAIGWSNGGNTLLVTLGKFSEQLPFMGWVAFYESPVGAWFYPPSLGGANDFLNNKHYRQGTAATGQVVVDLRNIAYQKDIIKNPGSHKKNDEPELKGVAFFDENKNAFWDEGSEFAFPYSTDIGIDKQIYPPAVTKALLQLPDFQPEKTKPGEKKGKKKEQKKEIPFVDYEESLAFFRERDGSQYIKQVVEAYPMMPFTVFGSHLDHLQRQSDHPHIAMLYNMLLDAKPKFLRLNPSSVYVGTASFMKPSTFVENRPNTSIDSDMIDQSLEPEGLLPDYVYMEAAAAELSDRVSLSKWTKVIEEPLVNYSSGVKPPEEPAAKGKEKSGRSAKEDSNGISGTAPTRGKPSSDKPSKEPGKDGSGPKDWPFK